MLRHEPAVAPPTHPNLKMVNRGPVRIGETACGPKTHLCIPALGSTTNVLYVRGGRPCAWG